VFTLAYLLVLLIAWPAVAVLLLVSGRWRRGLGERLGGGPRRDGDRPCLWVHGASVGEVTLARGFVAAWRQAHPDWDVAVSAFTPTGREIARKNFPDCTVCLFPLDFKTCIRRAFRRIRPSAVALVELEVWPNFMRVAKSRGVPVVVVNGRISGRSVRRYRWLPFRSTFRRVTRFCAQSEEFAARAREAGFDPASVTVTGNMKFDGLPEPPPAESRGALSGRLGIAEGERVLVGGSTHDPEERILLAAYEELKAAIPSLRLILVPRHPERAKDVALAAAEAGFETVLKTAVDRGETPPPDAVVVVDTVGELRSIWALAEVAYVGGSLTPRGGQNIMEPAALGRPVVFGPVMDNFREARDILLAAGGCVQVSGREALLPALLRLFQDRAAAAAMGDCAAAAFRGRQGATRRNVEALDAVLALRRSDP